MYVCIYIYIHIHTCGFTALASTLLWKYILPQFAENEKYLRICINEQIIIYHMIKFSRLEANL
jgi:hypothetical protein